MIQAYRSMIWLETYVNFWASHLTWNLLESTGVCWSPKNHACRRKKKCFTNSIDMTSKCHFNFICSPHLQSKHLKHLVKLIINQDFELNDNCLIVLVRSTFQSCNYWPWSTRCIIQGTWVRQWQLQIMYFNVRYYAWIQNDILAKKKKARSGNELTNRVKGKAMFTLRLAPSTEFRSASCCDSPTGWGRNICSVLPNWFQTHSKTPPDLHLEDLGMMWGGIGLA